MIFISIAMDVLIIGMMSYSNSFVYMMFHPVGYLVKLNIELAMSSLIVDIASAKKSKQAPRLEYTAEALQIAVHTVTHSTAVQLDDLGAGDEDPLRKTRTPARPDLAERLKKMRREKKEREGGVIMEEEEMSAVKTLDRNSKWGKGKSGGTVDFQQTPDSVMLSIVLGSARARVFTRTSLRVFSTLPTRLNQAQLRSSSFPSTFSQTPISNPRELPTSADAATPTLDKPVSEAKTYLSIQNALHPQVYKAVTDRPFRYSTMTDVQAAVLSELPRLSSSPSEIPYASLTSIDAIDQAQDLLVRAKTGTGKTLAFLIPALEGRLRSLESFLTQYRLENPEATKVATQKAVDQFASSSVGALIVSPTRELATQIAQEAKALTYHLPNFGVRLLVGGEPRGKQLRDFARPGASNDIVVGTPGRMVDLIQSESIVRKAVANTRMLILDEADTLLDMGFASEIASISEYIPPIEERQTFLFSATVSKSIREISRNMMKQDHAFIDTVGRDAPDTHLHIPQYYTVLPSPADQITHIATLIAQDQLLHPKGGKCVIFLPTTKLTQLYSL
ncbi:hypothetical protein P7C70_g5535, partial [Phenoliferia sp. Uapishka_3]